MSDKEKKRRAARRSVRETPDEAIAARRDAYDWIQCLITSLVICVVLFVFFIRVIDVRGSSMYPTLNNGDKMLVSGVFYTPKTGDVVVFKKAEYDAGRALVKRVIATEGQEINIDFDKGIVYVDGAAIEEDYISELTNNKLDFIGPKKVPENCVFVMGDNRNMSVDSRKTEIGMVDARLIIGRAYYVIFPLDEFGAIK